MKKIFILSILATSLVLSNCVVFEFLSSVSTSVESASESLESVSKSIKSISSSIDSSSDSSSADDEKTDQKEKAYRNDIREVTALFTGTNGTSKDFIADIRRVARNHQITNWESKPSTYIAIGAGLKQAGIASSQFEKTIESLDNDTKKLVQQGYSI